MNNKQITHLRHKKCQITRVNFLLYIVFKKINQTLTTNYNRIDRIKMTRDALLINSIHCTVITFIFKT